MTLLEKRRLAENIVRKLRHNGFEAYFVGGCVRDMILKRKPGDYDIASNAGPKNIKKLFKRTIAVGEAFGVMIVREGGESFEVSTFRTESDYKDGRRPTKVEFSDAESDASRRDFTVNGLFYDPLTKKTMDWVGGVKDIKKKTIRTIGEPGKRFKEDKLRMLRAIRFAANLGFKIDPKTFAAIKRMHKQISVVSAERIREELVKLFTGPNPGQGLVWLEKSGLLKVILPEVAAMKGVQQPREYHPEGDVFRHTRLMLDMLDKPSVILAFGCLLHDIGKPRTFKRSDRIRFNNHDRVGARMAEEVLTRLKFSNADKRAIVDCVDGHMRFKDAKHMKESTLKKMFQRQTFATELEQHRLDCLASHGDLSIWRFVKKKLAGLSAEQIRPEPFLRGRDLLEAGFAPGPEIGRVLKEAEAKQLDGEFSSKEDALRWALTQKK